MKNAEAEREKELKAAQQKLNQAKSKADAFNKRLKEKQQVLFVCYSSIRTVIVSHGSVRCFRCLQGLVCVNSYGS